MILYFGVATFSYYYLCALIEPARSVSGYSHLLQSTIV
jgi:hypothetical protein